MTVADKIELIPPWIDPVDANYSTSTIKKYDRQPNVCTEFCKKNSIAEANERLVKSAQNEKYYANQTIEITKHNNETYS